MTPTLAVSPGVEYAHRIGLLRFDREPDGTWLATADKLPRVAIRGRERADARRGILTLASDAL